MKGTQKTSINFVKGVQSEFHIYALEWTPNYIHGYIDGKQCFTFVNDQKGDKRPGLLMCLSHQAQYGYWRNLRR